MTISSNKKRALYVELPNKTLDRLSRFCNRNELPKTTIVRLAIEEFLDNEPQLELNLVYADTSKKR